MRGATGRRFCRCDPLRLDRAQREEYSPIKPRLARRGENRVPLPGRRGFLSQGASAIGAYMSGINWDYWRKLALWPLDVACQLVYGEEPKGMLPEDIRNPDIDGRPDSVSLYHQAMAAIKAGTLSTVFDLEVRPAEFLAWAQGQGISLVRELADVPCPSPASGWP